MNDRFGSSRFDDWFWYTGRSIDKGYVSPTRSKFGWEKDIVSAGKSYSSVFWRPSVNKNKGELITRAYNLAKEMILVMDTPTKVNIKILDDSCSEFAFTDGKVVFVSTSVFDSSLEESEAVDVFCGMTIHEGCHLLYSEMNEFKKWVDNHKKMKTPDLELRKHLFNLIEDERIEQELGLNKPGLLVFLEKMKNYFFGNAKDAKEQIDRDTDNELDKILSTLFQIVRYPKFLKEEDLDINFDFFSKVQGFLVPLPDSTKETLDVADNICELLMMTLKDIPEFKDKNQEEIATVTAECINKGNLSKIKDAISTEFLVGIDEDYSGTTEVPSSRKQKVSKDVQANKGVLGKILEGRYENGSDSDTVFVKSDSGWGTDEEKSRYLRDRDTIKRFIPSIKKILVSNNKDYTGVLHGCKTGTLDTTKLAEAYQGVEHVYFRNYQVKTKKTSVCVVIDESGSMCGDREVSARRAAILLNEAFKDLPGVSLYIYGHSADYLRLYGETSTDIYAYKEPGQKNKYALGSSRAKYENRDGKALREIAKRVRKFDQNEILMFILSDGSPSAIEYRGYEAIRDTKNAVLEIEKMGFIPIQISINAHHSPKEMFKNYAMITDLANLAPELGKLVKKAVLKSSTSNTITI